MSRPLIVSRRFLPLFLTQFFAAFNDNFLKNSLVFLVLMKAGAQGAASTVTLAGVVFIVPFLLLSALGGQLADKFDKAKLARNLKLAEIVAAIVAIAGMALANVALLMVSLFMFGVGSALFGPVKYGILPDHLEQRELPKANAWIEGATFIAILAGTVSAGVAFATGGASVYVFAPLIAGFAIAAYLSSCFVPLTGGAAPDIRIDANIVRSTIAMVGNVHRERRLWITALMSSWFWLAGTIILSVLPPLVRQIGGGDIAITGYLSIFAVSVGIGSALAAWLSGGRIVLLPVVVGTLLVGALCIDLGFAASFAVGSAQTLNLASFFATKVAIHVGFDLAGIAVGGALMAVPTFAALQSWAGKDRRARVIAGTNIVNAAFMTVGGAVVAGLQYAGTTVAAVLIGFGVLTAAVSLLMLVKLPTNPLRDALSILFRAFYRVEVHGSENLAAAGDRPVLILNHVSFLDAAAAIIVTDMDPVFAINTEIAERWWVRPFLKVCRALPIDPAKPMATRTLIRTVEAGNPVAIFPEGRITVTGSLMKVYDGAAMVADKTRSPVVPIRIEGLEKTHFSRLSSATRRRLFPKVIIHVMEPVRLEIDPDLKGRRRRKAAGAELYGIMSDLVFRTASVDTTIHQRVANAAREFGYSKPAVEDPVSGTLSYGRLLAGARVLADRFADQFPDDDRIGVMLPNANGTAATILAVMSAGKVPAMINFSAGAASIRSACKTAQLRTILTSRAFIDKARLTATVEDLAATVEFVYLEDIRETVTALAKIRGFLARSRPVAQRGADDPAVVMFTSGSEGTPKGVVLTHRNILSNAAQAAARIDFSPADKVFNVLPVFHSFGLTAGLILPLVSGVPVYLYPSPLHYRIVPELVYGSNATILFGTDTFLAGYSRTADAYDFRSLRYCFAGAEPVRDTTRTTYMEKFGLRVLEGYGVTETAPVIAINTPMFNRSGSVGKVLPGIETRLEAVAGIDEGGRLQVHGPNVMAGYLKADRPGILQPPEDGWYDTGDIVAIDGEGFVFIKGRAKRFAKIAGEMISLAAVEALAGEVWPDATCAVAALPDERKGERLVLLTDREGSSRSEMLEAARKRGISELSVPAEIVVGDVPLLGSGKVDFVAVKKHLEKRDSRSSAA